jgi:beta-lactam-binding protein with PASTA domain
MRCKFQLSKKLKLKRTRGKAVLDIKITIILGSIIRTGTKIRIRINTGDEEIQVKGLMKEGEAEIGKEIKSITEDDQLISIKQIKLQ